MRKVLSAAWVMIYFISSCGNRQENKQVITKLETDDPTFLALKDTAQNHLNVFIDSVAKHGLDSNYEFHVKSDFVQGDDREHMWSMIYGYKDGVFEGLFIDSGIVVTNVKKGDKVTIPKEHIEDWAIKDYLHNKTTGYFSDKYLRSKM